MCVCVGPQTAETGEAALISMVTTTSCQSQATRNKQGMKSCRKRERELEFKAVRSLQSASCEDERERKRERKKEGKKERIGRKRK